MNKHRGFKKRTVLATESKRVEKEKKSWLEKTHHHFVFGTWFFGSSFWPSTCFPTVLTPTLLPHIPPSLPLNLSEVLITDEVWCATSSSHAIQLPVCASRWPRCCSDKKSEWGGKMRSERERKTRKESKMKNFTLVSSWQHTLAGTHAIHFKCSLIDY